MKKFLLSFFILLVFAGFLFFAGWVQFALSPGQAGVLISKTSGIDSEPIVPGEFRWAWERLLPTNCKLLAFTLRPASLSFSASGALPFSEEYSRFLEGSPSFSWSFSATASVSARREALPSIVERRGIETDEELNALVAALAEEAFLRAVEKCIAGAAEDALNLRGGGESVEAIAPRLLDLASLFEEELPEELDSLSFTVTESALPDFALYATGGSLYAEYLTRHSEAALERALKAAEEEVASSEQMRLFAEWGSFLEKFPSLIDFLAVARDDASETLKILQGLRGAESPQAAASEEEEQ